VDFVPQPTETGASVPNEVVWRGDSERGSKERVRRRRRLSPVDREKREGVRGKGKSAKKEKREGKKTNQ
jgi:hypothetical protein